MEGFPSPAYPQQAVSAPQDPDFDRPVGQPLPHGSDRTESEQIALDRGVRGMESGDASASDLAFSAFVVDNHAGLVRMAMLLGGDGGVAEDLVQTALVRLYCHWARVGEQDPLSYTRRIIVNAHHDLWRRTRGRERLVDVVPDVRSGSADMHAVAENDAVVRALAELTLKERRVVVLRFLLDMSEAETARQLGIRPGSVKSTSSRALAKLRTNRHLLDTFAEEVR